MHVILVVLIMSLFFIFCPLPQWKSSIRPRIMFFLAMFSAFLGNLPSYLGIYPYFLPLWVNLLLNSLIIIFGLLGVIVVVWHPFVIKPKNSNDKVTLIYKIAEAAIIIALLISTSKLLISIISQI